MSDSPNAAASLVREMSRPIAPASSDAPMKCIIQSGMPHFVKNCTARKKLVSSLIGAVRSPIG